MSNLNNLFEAEAMQGSGIDPATLKLALAMSSRPQSVDLERFKLTKHVADSRRTDNEMSQLRPNLGVMAPLVAGLKTAGRIQQRGKDEKTLEELMSGVQAAQEQEAMQAQQAKAMERQRAQEAARVAREQQIADAETAHNRKIAEEAAKQEAIAANRAPVVAKPSTQDQVAAIQGNPSLSDAQKAEQLSIVAPGLLKHQQGIQEQEQKAKTKQQEQGMALETLNWLTEPGRDEALRDSVGGLEGGWLGKAKNAVFNQDAVTWTNRFEGLGDLLTIDSLDKMTGVLSESDIKLLRNAALNGLDITSGEGEVRAQLGALKNYYTELAGMGGDTGGAQAPAGGVPVGTRAKNPDPNMPDIIWNGTNWVAE